MLALTPPSYWVWLFAVMCALAGLCLTKAIMYAIGVSAAMDKRWSITVWWRSKEGTHRSTFEVGAPNLEQAKAAAIAEAKRLLPPGSYYWVFQYTQHP